VNSRSYITMRYFRVCGVRYKQRYTCSGSSTAEHGAQKRHEFHAKRHTAVRTGMRDACARVPPVRASAPLSARAGW
jgi:hypothetical protein